MVNDFILALEVFSKLDNVRLLFNKAEIKIIKRALIKAQEQEKVLEIIKNKEVDTFILMLCDNIEQYNIGLKNKSNRQLTKEEFDLLKKILYLK